MKKQVLVLNNPTQFNRSDENATVKLQDKVDVYWHHLPTGDTSPSDTLSLSPPPNILVTALVKVSRFFLQKIPELEAIMAASTAIDYIDLSYCKDNQIKVFNTPRYTGPSVAEHAFSLVMSCSKHLRRSDETIRLGLEENAPHSMELFGKRLGIIGLGEIGTRVSHYANSFGMEVVYFNRSRKTLPNGIQLGLEDLLASSDIVVMTVPLNKESYHLISRSELKLMKPSAFLVNIGADELIHIDHLVEALKNHEIAGAALDVISKYSRYLDVPNLILTQSKGWYTKESVERRMAGWISTLEAYLKQEYVNRVV